MILSSKRQGAREQTLKAFLYGVAAKGPDIAVGLLTNTSKHGSDFGSSLCSDAYSQICRCLASFPDGSIPLSAAPLLSAYGCALNRTPLIMPGSRVRVSSQLFFKGRP